MKAMNSLMFAALLAVPGLTVAGGPAIETGTAVCDALGATARQCHIRWDLSTTPRAAYGVQWLNPETGEWESVSPRRIRSPYASGGNVAAGRLYRVLGCDDDALTRNCVSTTAFWAPVIPPADSIPDSVAIQAADGEIQNAGISGGARLHTRVMQLNVYLLTDVLGRATMASLPPMTAPLEPGTPGDMTHDVHHNVHAAYEAARTYRERQQVR